MARALRVDKMTLAALDATLRSYARGRAVDEIPVWRMIAAPVESLHERAQSWQQRLAAAGLPAELWPGASAVGGGSLPGETLPTWLLALPAPAAGLPLRPGCVGGRRRWWHASRKTTCSSTRGRCSAEQEEELLRAVLALASTWKGNERDG